MNRNLYLILFLILISCKDNQIINKDTLIFDKFPETQKITFQNIFEYKKAEIGHLRLLNDHLFIFNYKTKDSVKFIYDFSLSKNKILNGYLTYGKGPNEVLNTAISKGIINNHIWVHDITNKKIMIGELPEENSKDTIRFKEYKLKHFFNSFDLQNDSIFYGFGSSHSTFKVQKVNFKSGKEVDEFGKFYGTPKNIPLDAVKASYNGPCKIKPTRDKAVVGSGWNDMIEIFDLNKKNSRATYGPEKLKIAFDPYKFGDSYANNVTKESYNGFVDINTTNKYIYGLFSGKLYSEESSNYYNTIYVYDWEGKPIKKITTDKKINCLAISKDDKIIYAYDENGFIVKAHI